MPIYEYGCKSCGHTLDALQKMSDDHLVDCPECGKPDLKRLLSAPRFRLKGSGWYETDFKKDNQRNIAKGDSESGASKADAKGDGKGDKSGSTDKSSKGDSKGTGSKTESSSGKSSGSSAAAD